MCFEISILSGENDDLEYESGQIIYCIWYESSFLQLIITKTKQLLPHFFKEFLIINTRFGFYLYKGILYYCI